MYWCSEACLTNGCRAVCESADNKRQYGGMVHKYGCQIAVAMETY